MLLLKCKLGEWPGGGEGGSRAIVPPGDTNSSIPKG